MSTRPIGFKNFLERYKENPTYKNIQCISGELDDALEDAWTNGLINYTTFTRDAVQLARMIMLAPQNIERAQVEGWAKDFLKQWGRL